MNKRALIFIEDGSFSYDNRVKREASALVDDGWDVTVISPKYPDDAFYKVHGPRLRAYHYPKPHAESALGHIVEHSISLALGAAFTGWVSARHGFTVFHACNPMDVLWLIALPYKLLGRRFIFDQHDLSPEVYLSRPDGREGSLFHRALGWLEKASYRLADATIATNESYKAVAVARGDRRPDEVFVVRNGPNLQRFRKVPPRPGLKADGQVLVGYLGNMNPADGVHYILEAADHIVNERGRRDLRFVLVGGGSSQPALVERCREMGLEDFVSFTGRIPDDEMLATLSACDLCVQPDPKNPLNDKSTMNKVMEYMALEKAVVAFDLVETRVSCGEAALLATPNEVTSMTDCILALADDPARRQELGRKGRARVEEKLAWSYSVPHLLGAYEHALRRA
jgi:glycosyltransferase involved in cell wall biosynthesis